MIKNFWDEVQDLRHFTQTQPDVPPTEHANRCILAAAEEMEAISEQFEAAYSTAQRKRQEYIEALNELHDVAVHGDQVGQRLGFVYRQQPSNTRQVPIAKLPRIRWTDFNVKVPEK